MDYINKNISKKISNTIFLGLILLFFIAVSSVGFAATISSVTTTTSDGNYKVGTVIPIKVTFSTDVNVNGTCSITLNSGGTATASTTSTPSTDVNFVYTIASGQNTLDLNYTDTAISCSDGNIVESVAGTVVTYTLPTGASSIGGTKNILIDTSAPTVTFYPASGQALDSNSITFDFNFLDNYSNHADIASRATIKFREIDDDTNFTITDGNVSVLPNGIYYLYITSTDPTGNTLSSSTTFYVDVNHAPTFTSLTHSWTTNYTNDISPTLTLSATDAISGMTDGNVWFSCTLDGFDSEGNYAFKRGYSTSVSDFNITSSSYDCNTNDGNKTIYAKIFDKAGNAGSRILSAGILYDPIAPKTPVLSVSGGNTKITLSWEDVTDALSGVEYYKYYVYYYTNSNLVKSGTISESYNTIDINNLTNDRNYYVNLTAIDHAGNESEKSNTVYVTPSALTINLQVKRNGISTRYANAGDILTITCDYAPEAQSKVMYYKNYTPTQSAQELSSEVGYGLVLTGSRTMSLDYAQVGFWCEGKVNGITKITDEIRVSLHSTKPTISWNTTMSPTDGNNVYSGIKVISVKATDDAGIEKVEFYVDDIKSNRVVSKSGDNYSIDLNTVTYDNGSKKVSAIAYDYAGMTSRIDRTIEFENNSTPTQKAQKAVKDAETKRTACEKAISDAQLKAIKTDSLTSRKQEADALVVTAKTKLDASSIETTKSAIAIYNEIIAKLNNLNSISTVVTYTANTISQYYKNAGIADEFITESTTLGLESQTTRKIYSTTVEGKNQLTVGIKVYNDKNETKKIRIFEFIPKELVENASQINSGIPFVVIQADPVIAFDIEVAPNTEKNVYYRINKENFDINEIASQFTIPVMVLGASTTFNGPPQRFDLVLIMIIGGVVLVLALIAGFFMIKVKPIGQEFGESKPMVEHLIPKKEESKSWPKNEKFGKY